MQRLFILILVTVNAESSSIFTRRITSIPVSSQSESFSISAVDVPADAFLVASFDKNTDFRIESNIWIRNYDFYSITNYIDQVPNLTLTSNFFNYFVSVTICSFTQPISITSTIQIDFATNTTSYPCTSVSTLCTPSLTKLSSSSFQTYTLYAYTTLFFYLSINQSENIKIVSLSGTLHSFFKYSNESSGDFPSFLSTDNDFDDYGAVVEFKTQSGEKDFVFFSVFCLDNQTCKLEIWINEDDKEISEKTCVLAAVLTIFGAVAVVGVGYMLFGKPWKRKKIEEKKGFVTMSVDKEMKRVECCICFEDYEKSGEVVKIGCGHFFHSICFSQWAVNKSCCPLCRFCFKCDF